LDGLSGDILYEAQVKYKTKMLGNIKLVGQLIRHGMLSPKIALSVAGELIRDDPMVRDERLETLAVFLETVGPTLDDPNWSHSAQFETVFGEVQRLGNDRKMSSRIRFLLRDVIELRREGWVQTRKAKSADADAPTTIAGIHEKAKLDQSQSLGAERGAERGGGGRRGGAQNEKNMKISRNDFRMSSTSGTPLPSPTPSPKAKPFDSMRRYVAKRPTSSVSSPGGEAIGNGGMGGISASLRNSKDGLVAGLQKAIASADTKASKSKDEILAVFHKEVAQIIRQVGNAISVAEGVQRLRECSLPSECIQEEVVDLIARMVDEPKDRRKHLFPLLRALFDAGVFSPPALLSSGVASFIEEAFVDPGSVDPPDLIDIVLRELLPALGLALGMLSIPTCIRELFSEIED
jgi:hypothetical protein